MDDNAPSNQLDPLWGENFAWELVEALRQEVTIMGQTFALNMPIQLMPA